MKRASIYFFFLINLSVMGQSFNGSWVGTLQNINGKVPSEMTLKEMANNTVEGMLQVSVNGAKDAYILKGNLTKNLIKGTLTYKDGTVFNFKMELYQQQVRQEISYNGQVILEGTFAKNTQLSHDDVKPITTDGLYRDPRLIGRWTTQENYSSNGGFYGGSSTTIILNADGSIDDGGSSSYVSGPNSSGQSQGGGNSAIAQVKAAGARWYTKDNIFYWRLWVNGKETDVPNSKYYIENGALLLTDLKTGKKLLYYKK
ncbi:hypothetical protein [Emticicia sp. 17c]|uniref:hypothetical protein n=1 Tax=Emticicia sp. 17c TaxID=3127704 RepID=UPI00301B6DB0